MTTLTQDSELRTQNSSPPTPPGILRTLILKELRQNLVFLGLVFCTDFILVSILEWFGSDFYPHYFRYNGSETQINILLFPFLRSAIAIACPTAALLIGIFQPLADLNFDRWSFLIHRPVPRSTLFLGRMIAGLLLYLAAVGIPLASILIYAATPKGGQFFLFQYTLPSIADFFAAIPFYFAGLLLSERQARFYGSRIAPLILALTASIAAALLPSFTLALLVPLLITLPLAAAALTSHTTHGYTLTAPAPRRLALNITLFLSFSLLLFYIATDVRENLAQEQYRLLSNNYSPSQRFPRPPKTFTHHVLYPNGSLAIETTTFTSEPIHSAVDNPQFERFQRVPKVTYTDFQDHPLPTLDSKALDTIEQLHVGFSRLYHYYAFTGSFRDTESLANEMNINWSDSKTPPSEQHTGVFDSTRNIAFVFKPDPTGKSTRGTLIGTFGINGFVPLPGRAKPFPPGLHHDLHTVYNVSFKNLTVTPIFTTAPSETILRLTSTVTSQDNEVKSEGFAVVLPTRIVLLSDSGQILNQLPPPTHDIDKSNLSIRHYVPLHRWIIQYSSSTNTGPPHFTHIPHDTTEFYDDNLTLLASDNYSLSDPSPLLTPDQLTPEEQSQLKSIHANDGLATAAANPLLLLAANPTWRYFHPRDQYDDYYDDSAPRLLYALPTTSLALLTFSLTLLASAALTFLAASLYRLRAASRLLWPLLALLTGPAALLTLIATHSLPRRQKCPTCTKRRPLASPNCPHCHSPWPPPPKTNTEIFTPSQP